VSSPWEASRLDLLAALVRGVGRTSAQHATFSTALAAQLGIGPTDLECLLLLQESGPASAGQLAEVLSLTTGAITGVVDHLEAAGFVLRESDPSDRRRVIVRPVAKRMADVERAYSPLLQAAARSLQSYSEHDLRLLVDFQQRVSQLMQLETTRLKADFAPSSAAPLFAAALGDVSSGCLEFATGASELRVFASDQPGELYHAAFEGTQPAVRVQNGSVTFRYKRMGLFDWGKHSGAVALNATIPWSIALRGGASRVNVDGSRLRLQNLSIDGGASKLEIVLGPPRGTVPVCIGGGLSGVQLQRPVGVPAQVQIRGGANRLEFDSQRFGVVGGDVRLASPGWDLASDRYAIEVQGGASRFEIHQVQED
jgi:DNA-binding MarR family transcriptional regulator